MRALAAMLIVPGSWPPDYMHNHVHVTASTAQHQHRVPPRIGPRQDSAKLHRLFSVLLWIYEHEKYLPFALCVRLPVLATYRMPHGFLRKSCIPGCPSPSVSRAPVTAS